MRNRLRTIISSLISLFIVLISSMDTYAQKTNIIFVFADDWGFGDLGCYGNKEVSTPNLDKLASQGTRYTQFHVTSGVCSPSRSSVITDHFPVRHRIHGHFAVVIAPVGLNPAQNRM